MTPAEPGLPRFFGWLRPIVDAVARIHSGVHRKLLFGFLTGALLLVGMAILSLVVMHQMNGRLVELDRAQVKASRAQEMLYAVTAQSHYRAMALLIPVDAAKYNSQVDDAKTTFANLLAEMERDEPDEAGFLEGVGAVNDSYEESGRKVLALFEKKDIVGATALHLGEEHPTSHLLERAPSFGPAGRTPTRARNPTAAPAGRSFRRTRSRSR